MPECVAPGMLDHTGPADGLLDGSGTRKGAQNTLLRLLPYNEQAQATPT
jgi:hypothetical protein